MMLFTCVKDSSGNVERVGADCENVPLELEVVLKKFHDDGCVDVEIAEYDEQVIRGATSGWVLQEELDKAKTQIEELEAKVAELSEKLGDENTTE